MAAEVNRWLRLRFEQLKASAVKGSVKELKELKVSGMLCRKPPMFGACSDCALPRGVVHPAA